MDELNNTFGVLLQVVKSVHIDEIICLGDWYDKKRPSAKEIDFGTYWAIKLKNICNKFVMLRGNHPTINNKISSVEYLKHLNIDIVDDYISDNIFFGHFMTDKTPMYFGYYAKDTKLNNLKNYRYILLGHYHIPYQLANNAWHIGSCRFVTFNEANTKSKQFAIIDDKDIHFITLSTIIPMIDVDNINKLDNLDGNYKIRLVYKDFDKFKKEINQINKYKKKFKQLKLKLDFTLDKPLLNGTKTFRLKDKVINWLNKLDNDIKIILENEFKEYNII